MLTIWGRATSSNVQKVSWTCDGLAVPFERRDAGREFGQVDQDWAALIDTLAQTWSLVDRQRGTSPYLAGDSLSRADIALGNSIRRWTAFEFDRPDLPNLAAWHKRLAARPGFQRHMMGPMV